VASDSICGSLTAPALNIGVSTSSTPRAAKKSRMQASMRARVRNAESVAVGCQSKRISLCTRYYRWPGRRPLPGGRPLLGG